MRRSIQVAITRGAFPVQFPSQIIGFRSFSTNAPKEDLKSISTKSLADIKTTQTQLVEQFKQTDLAVLEKSFADVYLIAKTYFTDSPFWTLFWKNDYFVLGLKQRMRQTSMLVPEYQMVYALGKAVGVTASLGNEIKERFKDQNVPESIKFAVDSIPDAKEAMNMKVVDKFALRNQIASLDDSAYFSELSLRINNLVKYQFISQGLIFGVCLLSTHFGVPVLMAIPAGLVSSGLSLTWMNSKYSGIQQDFLLGLSQVHKTLLHNLEGTFEEKVRTLVDPVKMRCDQINKTIN